MLGKDSMVTNPELLNQDKRKKIEYIVVKCHSDLLEDKLNENGSFGWELVCITGERRVNQRKIELGMGNQPEEIYLLVLSFKREKL